MEPEGARRRTVERRSDAHVVTPRPGAYDANRDTGAYQPDPVLWEPDFKTRRKSR